MFQNQRNIFAGLAQGIERAGQSLAGFFSRRAEQQYNQGVDAIAQARVKLQEIQALEQNPNARIEPEHQAVLNSQRAYWEAIAAASPMQALELMQQPAPGGVDIRNIERVVTPASPGRPQAPRGVESGTGEPNPPAEPPRPAETVTERQVTPAPFQQMFNQLARQAGIADLERQERLIAEEREFILARDTQGQEVQVRLADMEALAALERQKAQIAADLASQNLSISAQQELQDRQAEIDERLDAERARLASQYRMSEMAVSAAYTANQTRLEASLDEQAAQAAFGRSTQFTSLEAALETAAGYMNTVNDPTQPMEVRQAAAEALRVMRDSDQLGPSKGLYAESILEAGLARVDEGARQARIAEQQAAINAGELSGVELERAEQEVNLLKQQIRIGNQTIRMNDVILQGERQRQAIEAFEHNVSKVTSVTEFIEGAINLGLTGQLLRLREEVIAQQQGGSVHADLAHLTAGVDMRALNQAIRMSEDSANLAGRKQELALAEIDAALRDLQLGDVAGRMELVGRVGQSGMSEEDIRNDPNLQQMVAAGLLTEGDINAMVGRSLIRQQLETETVNGPKINRLLDRLSTEYTSKRPAPGQEDAAEAGLRATLQELVELDALSEEEVEGIVDLYRRAWVEGGDMYAAELALTRAQGEAFRAQARASRAAADRDASGPGFDLNAAKWRFESELEILGNMYPGCGELPSMSEAEGALAAGVQPGNCDAYRAELATLRNNQEMLMMEVYGFSPSDTVITDEMVTGAYEAVVEQYGEDAGRAWALSRGAAQQGLPVDPFVEGVDDPREWMSEWGSSEAELLLRVSPEGIAAAEDKARSEYLQQAQAAEPHWEDLVSWWAETDWSAPWRGDAPLGLTQDQWAARLGMTRREFAQALGAAVQERRRAGDIRTPVGAHPFTDPTAGAVGPAAPPPAGVEAEFNAVSGAVNEINAMFSGWDALAPGASMNSPNNNNANRARVNELLEQLREQFPGLNIPNKEFSPGEARTELNRILGRLRGS